MYEHHRRLRSQSKKRPGRLIKVFDDPINYGAIRRHFAAGDGFRVNLLTFAPTNAKVETFCRQRVV